MVLKIKDRNDILLLVTMDEVSRFTERWPFLVQFGWELHRRYQIRPLFFWLLAVDKFNFTTEILMMAFKTVVYNLGKSWRGYFTLNKFILELKIQV